MELLERQNQLDELARQLREAEAGRGKVAFVAGEAGAGKSALIEAFASGSRRGVRIVWGACDALQTPRALGPIHEIAASLAVASPSAEHGEHSRPEFFARLVEELAQPAQANVVMLEDLHWADEATLDFVHFLGRRIQRTRCLLIGTYRDDELATTHPLRRVLGEITGQHATRIRVPALSQAAVAKLAHEAHRDALRIYEVTCGNAFFVRELLTAPSDSLPESVRDAVIARFMGGSQGEVSVRYQITTTLDSDIPPATAGQDFTAVTGRVTWRDGEAQDQEIRVPISSTDEIPESLERFLVTLDDAQGQAGLGTRSAAVDIEGTVDPAGRFDFEVAAVTASEASGFANVTVARHFYGKGPVSVTVTPVAGTATADSDFAPEPITVSWVDNDFTSRIVQIPLRNDSTIEQRETFTVQLSNPTGGAFIGPDSTATVSIVDDDATKQNTSQGGGGGGGAFGILSVLLLGAVRFLRTLFRPGHRGRAPP